MRTNILRQFFILLVCASLSACGLSAEQQAATATQQAAWDRQTLTASAPTATRTPLPPTATQTSTATPTNTPTLTSTPSVTPTPRPTATRQGSSIYGIPFVLFTAWDGHMVGVYATNLDEEPLEYYALTDGNHPSLAPVWSPDSLQIAYLVNDLATDEYYFNVFDLVTAETTKPSQLPVNPMGSFCWTYDARYLVWSDSQPDGAEMDVYRMDVQTGEITDLTQDSPVWDAFPACSPVSDQIAFVSDRAPQGKDTDNIWVMDSQGGSLTQLTNTPGWENAHPAWSRDGNAIAYFHGGFEGLSDPAYGPGGVYVVSADGGEARLLVEDETLMLTGNEAPLWSPDGQYLAYAIGFEDSVIYIATVAEGEVVWSSDLPGRNNELSWSANSAYLLFTNTQNELSRIYIIAIADPDPVPLLPDPDNFLGAFAP